MGVEPALAKRSSKALRVAAMATLVLAVLLAILLALASLRWLAWVEVGLVAVGLGLGLAAWMVHRVEDRFDALAARQVHRALASQARRLAAFREIAAAGGQSLDLQEVLELGLEKALQVTGRVAAEIHLLDSDGQAMATRASVGKPEGFLMRKESFTIGECLCGLAVLNDEALIVSDIQNDPRVTRSSCLRFGFQSAACVPLRVKGRAVGVLTVHGHEKHHFDDQDVELLGTMADQLATAIENARLYAEMEARVEALSRELQYMAVVEERERLGREMHDGLAQTLSLLSLQVGQSRSLLLSGNAKACMDELREMSRVIDAGYEEVREAINNLRLAAPKGEKFAAWLQEYVDEFGLRHDLATELYIAPGSSPLVLLPYQEVHFTRIIQEALNNVRKHSQASRVQMAIIPNAHKLTLRVEDDGAGFDLKDAQSQEGRYGLSTMRERAELLGGELRIQSAPGLGTMITVEIERETTSQG